MNCPKCGAALHAWECETGGYFGVECPCGEHWHSADVDEALMVAKRRAVTRWMANAKFPKDAMTDEEHDAACRRTVEQLVALRSGVKR
jgi:hypothetical protein